MIITVGGIKGGTGKSTVATNLSVWLIGGGHDVLLIDADEQGTATDFAAARNDNLPDGVGFSSIKLTGPTVRREIERMRKKFDHIVVDAGGHDTSSQRAAIFMSDVYLLPFQSRSPDVWTSDLALQLFNEVRALREDTDLVAYSFLNRADVRSGDNREAATALAGLDGITFLEVQLCNRKAYSNAISMGLSVTELPKPDEKAIKEVNALFSIITKI